MKQLLYLNGLDVASGRLRQVNPPGAEHLHA